jgi:uncharacterized cupin superfamily protein
MSDDLFSTADVNAEPTDRFVRLRSKLGVTSFGINVIVLGPGQRNRVHRHGTQEEVYLILDGTLTLGVEGEEHDFGVGQVVRLAPEVRRQLVNRGPGPVRLLALGGQVAHTHEARDAEAFTGWEATEWAGPADVPLPDDLPESERRG